MKYISTLFCSMMFFLLTKQVASAQSFPSIFGHTSTSWVYAWYNLDSWGADSIYVSGDETADGKSYKRIKSRRPNTDFREAYLREDTLAGKVWYRNVSGDTTEYLAYQYGLLPGDSFNVNYQYGSAANADLSRLPWARVDSIQIKNGIRHVYFNVDLFREPLAIVEGIGYSTGIIFNYNFGKMGGQYLLCSYKDGVKTAFANIRYNGSCRPPTSISSTANKETPQLSVYPNPATGVVRLTPGTGKKIDRLELFSADGRLVLASGPPVNNEVSVSHLPAGSYYLRCCFKDSAPVIQKLIVQ